jgi:hypothetical protein
LGAPLFSEDKEYNVTYRTIVGWFTQKS